MEVAIHPHCPELEMGIVRRKSISVGNHAVDRLIQLLIYQKNVSIAALQYYDQKEYRARVFLGVVGLLNSVLVMVLPQVLSSSQVGITSIVVGALGLIIGYFQDLVKKAKFPVKKDQFRSAAEQYEDLEAKLTLGVYAHDDPDLVKKMQSKMFQVRKNTKVRAPLCVIQSIQQ